MATPKTAKEVRVDPVGFAPITEKDGKATPFFARQWQNLVGLVQDTRALILDVFNLENAEIIAGSGLTGGGTLQNSPITLTANASAILDQLSSTHGTVLYRGASAWSGLAPGTSGYILSTNGGGVDPAWIVAPSGGGGGGGGYFSGATGVPTGTSTSATATKGTVFTPLVDITVQAVWAVYDAAAASQAHNCVVADINSVAGGVVGAVTGTTNSYNSIDTNVRAVRFDFASPITMLAGVAYIVALSNTSGTGTTICRVGDIAQSATSMSAFWEMNAPGDSAVQVHDYNTTTLTAAQSPTSSASTVQHTLWLEAEWATSGGTGLDHGKVMVRVSLGF